MAAHENPFSAQRIRPGVLPYWFADPTRLDQLIEQILAQPASAIIGPHGTGKSTLLKTLLPELERRCAEVAHISLHDLGQRVAGTLLHPALGFPSVMTHPPPDVATSRHATDSPPRPALLIVDSFEQLGLWRRWQVIRASRRSGIRLLVTAHREIGLPAVHRSDVTRATTEEVWRQLTQDVETPVTMADLTQALAQTRGDLREALFACYDLHERRSAQASNSPREPRRLKPRSVSKA